jgi:hypothetical protein
MELQKINNYENIIVILSIIAVSLVIYRMMMNAEKFEQVDICDYNSPDPNEFCQSIQKGCSDLIYENKNLNQNMKDNCNELPKDTKDMIDTAIVCNDTSNKLIMNNYVQKEVCSQIKNFPEVTPPTDVLTPSVNLLQQQSLMYVENTPAPTYKPLDPLLYLSKDDNNTYSNINYASF